ncbi:MAG: hypothetical protein DSY42_09270 [Aquifex sp.]|nr:MAG: hypothetical protein DSY42_09270 [Aquifex sp.]
MISQAAQARSEVEPRWDLIEQEIEMLKDVITQQNSVIRRLGDQVLTPSRPTVSFTKPRDIPQLQLHQLQGLEAAARLQMFFELIEQCSDDDQTRVQVAKGRVSSELAMLVHNNQLKNRCKTWLELKRFLKTEFAVDVNLDRAWQEIESATYDWGDSPQAFTNNYICQYAVLETRFPNEKFPNRDKSIKRKLWHGLPQESKERLEAFLDEDYPLHKFIDRVEHERQMLEVKHTPTLHRVKGDKYKGNPQIAEREQSGATSWCAQYPPLTEEIVMQPTTSKEQKVTPDCKDEKDWLQRQISELREQVKRLTPRETGGQPSPNVYCPHCRSSSHSLRECWSKPSYGACFDCRRQGCWRGNKNCPGKSEPRT